MVYTRHVLAALEDLLRAITSMILLMAWGEERTLSLLLNRSRKCQTKLLLRGHGCIHPDPEMVLALHLRIRNWRDIRHCLNNILLHLIRGLSLKKATIYILQRNIEQLDRRTWTSEPMIPFQDLPPLPHLHQLCCKRPES